MLSNIRNTNSKYRSKRTSGSLLYYFQIKRRNIELLFLAALVGISSAYLFNKYMTLTRTVEDATQQAFFGNLQSGLLLFASKKLMATGKRTYPTPASPLLKRVMTQIPENWSYEQIDNIKGEIKYIRNGKVKKSWYYSTFPSFPDSTEFSIQVSLKDEWLTSK